MPHPPHTQFQISLRSLPSHPPRLETNQPPHKRFKTLLDPTRIAPSPSHKELSNRSVSGGRVGVFLFYSAWDRSSRREAAIGMAAPSTSVGSNNSARAVGKIERAHQLYREGRHTEALVFYTEALAMAKTRAQNIALHSNRAACYLKLQLFQKAADECSAVLELDHQHTGALMLRAQTLVTLKEYRSALFDVNRLMELNPSSEVYRNLQTRLKTQLSLAPIPESEEETCCEDEQTNVDEREQNVSAKALGRRIESPKAIIETKACTDNVRLDDAGKKSPMARAKPITKAAEGELVGIFSEEQESAMDKEKTDAMQMKKSDKPADLQSDKNESAKGANVLLKMNSGKAQDPRDKKNEFAVAGEASAVEKKHIDKSTDVQSKKSEFPAAKEPNVASEKFFNTSADALDKKSGLVAKEVNALQKRSVDNLAASLNKKNESTVAGANVVPKTNVGKLQGVQRQNSGSAIGREANMVQRKDGDNSTFVQKNGWETIPKPKGHSGLDYSRWESVESDSSDDEDDDEEEEQPRYRFRVRTIGVRPVR